jgi:hypothetical protein
MSRRRTFPLQYPFSRLRPATIGGLPPAAVLGGNTTLIDSTWACDCASDCSGAWPELRRVAAGDGVESENASEDRARV